MFLTQKNTSFYVAGTVVVSKMLTVQLCWFTVRFTVIFKMGKVMCVILQCFMLQTLKVCN